MIRRTMVLALALTGLPAVAAPQAPATASGVIERWIDAVGGEKRLKKAGRVVVRGDAVDEGVAAKVEEWVDGDAWRRVSVAGARTEESVCSQGVAWFKDWNGQVRELAGRDHRDQLTEARIASLIFGGALIRLASSREAELLEAGAAASSDTLKITPKDGVPFDLVLDRKTSLPIKAVRKPYEDEITIEFADWRAAQGRKVPFSVRERTEDGEADASTVVREVLPVAQGARPPMTRPADGPKDCRFDAGSAAEGIPFNFENDHIMVQGQVNGKKALWFMLDTGAEATIVNKPRMEELGLTAFGASSISGGGNATDFAFTEVARLRIGTVELRNQRDGVIDLSGLEKIYGMPMGGILGYDFFSRFLVHVDYDKKTLDLSEPSGFVDRGTGVKLPFVLEKGQPHIPATITLASPPPLDADLIVDCGAADTVNMTSPFVKSHQLLTLARKKPADAPNTMAGSEKEFFAQTSVRGRLSGLALGSFTLADIPCNLMVGTTGAYASDAFSGTLGEGVLHRFNTVYDYSRQVMFLSPNAELAKPFPPRKTFGATLLSDGPDYTRFTVTGIRKSSPAELAGLAKGDVIAAVDGRPAAELTLGIVRKLLAEEGAHRVLTIQRTDRSLTIECDVALVSLDEP